MFYGFVAGGREESTLESCLGGRRVILVLNQRASWVRRDAGFCPGQDCGLKGCQGRQGSRVKAMREGSGVSMGPAAEVSEPGLRLNQAGPQVEAKVETGVVSRLRVRR